MRRFIADIDWTSVQAQYDSGMSTRDIGRISQIGSTTFRKARDLGLFCPRTISDAVGLRLSIFPRDYASARSNKTKLQLYRLDSAFKFNVFHYPAEFDIAMITELGWYSAKNRGNNAEGVSRDHILSVRFGFDNDIDPQVVAHPANCRLMKQRDNASKSLKSSLTLDELEERIKEWDRKYPTLGD